MHKVIVQPISVFGATGFVGSNFCKYSEHETVSIQRDKLESTTPEIVYFIGTTDNYNIFSDPTIDIKYNIELLVNVLEANRRKFGIFKFNLISSWFVYGEGPIPYREDSNCNPRGFYSISKYAAEMFLTSYCETFNIDYRILRLANVFGPNDSGVSNKKNALQYLVNKIKNNQDIELYEGGEIIRDYIHVEDVVRAIDLIIDTCPLNIIVNIGSGKPTRLKDLMDELILYRKSTSKVTSIPTPEFQKKVQVRNSYLDTSYLNSFGFSIVKPIHEMVYKL